jgi:hypothetical protein
MAKKKNTTTITNVFTFADFKQEAENLNKELFNCEFRAVYFDGVNVWEYLHATGEKRISEVLTDYGE